MVWAWVTFFLFYKQNWESEYQNQTSETVCQDFIKECCNKKWSYLAWGWMMVYETHDDWRTNIDDECEKACPKDCNRYTEERWYFKDKEKQKEYYNNKVAECKKEYEECLQNTTWLQQFEECHDCNKYWDPIYYRN